jgi:hypothetical protein
MKTVILWVVKSCRLLYILTVSEESRFVVYNGRYEAVGPSVTLVNTYQTKRNNIPEGRILQTLFLGTRMIIAHLFTNSQLCMSKISHIRMR